MATTKNLEQHIENIKQVQSTTTTTTTTTTANKARYSWAQAVSLALQRQMLNNGGSNVVSRKVLEEEELETIATDAGSISMDMKSCLGATLRAMQRSKWISSNGRGMKSIIVHFQMEEELLSVMGSKEKVEEHQCE